MSFAGRRALTQLGSAGTQRAIIRDLLGPNMSWDAIRNIGSIAASYANAHLLYEDNRWNATKDSWDAGGGVQGVNGGAYYDRPAMLYQLYAMTGDDRYKVRADLLCANLRNNYFIPNSYSQSFLHQWMQPRSQYIDYAINGTSAALNAVGRLADYAASSFYTTATAATRTGSVDSRILGRGLQTVTWAKYANAPSAAGNNWSTILPTLLTNTLAWQDADGAVRNSSGWHSKAFMQGILADCMIDYWRLISQDSRIPTFVKNLMDYVWTYHWDAQLGAFYYLDGDDTNEPSSANGGTYRSADVNQFMSGIFWWIYARTGDTTYRDKGDRIFIEGVNRNVNSNPLTAGKQYNESYVNVYRYFDDRGLSPMVSSSLGRIISSTGSATWAPPHGQWTDLGAGTASDGVGHAWSVTLNGFGTSAYLADFYPQPSYGVKGRVLLHAKLSSGTKNVVIKVSDGISVFGQPDVSTSYALTTSWQWVGVTDTIIMPGGTGSFSAWVDDNADAAGSRTVIIDAVDIGVGVSAYTPPLVPLLNNTFASIQEPTVSGTYTSGSTLTATAGNWLNSPTSRTWRWFRDGIPITSATSSTYTLVSADVGHYVVVEETPSNAVGAGTPVKSRTPSAAVT